MSNTGTKSGAVTVIRSLYLYAVCLITLLTCLFAAVSGVNSAVDIAWPDPYIGRHNPMPLAEDEAETSVDSEAQEEWLREEIRLQERADRRDAVKGLLGSTITLLFAAPLFVFHWKAASRERNSSEGNKDPSGP